MAISKKGPTEKQFDICFDVLQWLTSWYEENEPQATVTIDRLKSVAVEIPENVAELEDGDDDN